MNEEQMQQYSQIVAKCWADAEFKAKLMADPNATLAAEGIAVPEGIELRIVENTPAVVNLVLPATPGEGELSDDALGDVAGGQGLFCGLNNGGPCYITTATLKARGLDEAEAEGLLNVFRSFRDNWLQHRPEGPDVIADYYRTAPRLVEALDHDPDSAKLYQGLWNQYLSPWMDTIERGEPDTAYRIYMDMVDGLKARYPAAV